MLKNLPFTFESWDLQNTFCWTFYNVKFTNNFGTAFSENDTFSCLDIDLEDGSMKAYATDGRTVIAEEKVEILPSLV